jgi:hypothetical protein
MFDPRAQKGRRGSWRPASPSATKALTADRIPMAWGCRWAPGIVEAVLRSVALDDEDAA